MRYKVVTGQLHDLFSKEVTGYLSAGWRLYGAPFVNANGYYCQAMTNVD